MAHFSNLKYLYGPKKIRRENNVYFNNNDKTKLMRWVQLFKSN